MKRDSRLSIALHALLHMAGVDAITSENLAQMAQSHPVAMRRTMAGLRDAGIVRSEKGHGGGWTLARPLEKITLRDVWVALDSPTLFAIAHRSESPGCLVERAVNASMGSALDEAEALLLKRLDEITLADLMRKVPAHHPGKKHAHV